MDSQQLPISYSQGVLANESDEEVLNHDNKDDQNLVAQESSDSSELGDTVNSIIDEFFRTNEMTSNEMSESISQMIDCDSNDEQMKCFFQLFNLIVGSKLKKTISSMKTFFCSNLPRIESSVLKNVSCRAVRNKSNSNHSSLINVEPATTENDQHSFKAGPSISNGGDFVEPNEKLTSHDVDDVNWLINSEQYHNCPPLDIDIEDSTDADEDEEDDKTSEKSDESDTSTAENYVETDKENEPKFNSMKANNFGYVSPIRIPNIMKDLTNVKRKISNDMTDDNGHGLQAELTSNSKDADSNIPTSDAKTDNEKVADSEKEFFSELSDCSTNDANDIDLDSEKRSENAQSTGEEMLREFEQICGPTITGELSDDSDNFDEDEKYSANELNQVGESTEQAIDNGSNDEEESGESQKSDVDECDIDGTESETSDCDNGGKTNNEFKSIDNLINNANRLLNLVSPKNDKLCNISTGENNDSGIVEANMMTDEDEEEEDYTINTQGRRSKGRLLSDEENDDQSDDSSDFRYDSGDARPSRKKNRKRTVSFKNGDDSDSDSSRSRFRKKMKTNKNQSKETKNAEKAERERHHRIAEKQKLYNKLKPKDGIKSSKVDRVILDFDSETGQVLVEVNKEFVKHLKPHQVDGIKFLYDCTIETLKQLLEQDYSGGGILAHSMGLGKTFQIIAFLHTIMTNERIKQKISRVLIIVPYNVSKNWANEFDKWFGECEIKDKINLFEVASVKPNDQLSLMKSWFKKGGILLITTKLFSNILCGKCKKYSNAFATYQECLLDPGADMVIIDEGHLLKNDQSMFNRSVSQVKSMRRIILTGTPLQNNLYEYFTMVNFVKPRLLGTKKEFRDEFVIPIREGENNDSSPEEVRYMKKRVHVLHNLLKDCINRCGYDVLIPYLQPKYEYVLELRLTQTQVDLYTHYLKHLVDRSNLLSRRLFKDYTILSYIWNHPALLHEYYEREKEKKEMEDSMDDFVVLGSSDDSDAECKPEKQMKSSRKASVNSSEKSETDVANETKLITANAWYEPYLPEEIYKEDLSSKFILLYSILEMCEKIGDKILIFSQSLFNLDLIERFLETKMGEYSEKYGRYKSYEELVRANGGVSHRWIPGTDYFRIDGSVNLQKRTSIIKKFNSLDNYQARVMMVSTRAGGIGINLVGANRCIIFDASWNPSNDMQAIFRIFRFGQTKPVYVYRFTAFGTMENRIYRRQIAKQSLSHRVVDGHQITRHYKASELRELYTFNNPATEEQDKVLAFPKEDNLLADIFIKHKELVISYHEHDSLLENKSEEELTEEERKLAWDEYETKKEREYLRIQSIHSTNIKMEIDYDHQEECTVQAQPQEN